MAYFAKLNKDNIVEDVFVIADEALLDESGSVIDKIGVDLCRYLSNYDNWIKTDYADKGYSYDAANGIFISPKPYDSWVLINNHWEAPISMSSEEGKYFWNENILNWELDESN